MLNSIYVVPVRYVDAVSISRHCATKGQAEWVQADHLRKNIDTSYRLHYAIVFLMVFVIVI
jgi:hypothetical protein